MTGEQHPQRHHTDKETTRLEAFSDGVFAIAITILALEIVVPSATLPTNDGVLEGILGIWPKYFAYINSFATVLLMWASHHSLFKMIKRTNARLFIANGFLLMLACLTPFPTKTLGEFINTPGMRTAAVFYTGYFILISLAFTFLWFVIKDKRTLLNEDVTEEKINRQTRMEFVGMGCNILITFVSFLNPWLGLILNTLMWIYWFSSID